MPTGEQHMHMEHHHHQHQTPVHEPSPPTTGSNPRLSASSKELLNGPNNKSPAINTNEKYTRWASHTHLISIGPTTPTWLTSTRSYSFDY